MYEIKGYGNNNEHVTRPESNLWMFFAAQRLEGVTVCSTMELSPSTAILHAVEEG